MSEINDYKQFASSASASLLTFALENPMLQPLEILQSADEIIHLITLHYPQADPQRIRRIVNHVIRDIFAEIHRAYGQ